MKIDGGPSMTGLQQMAARAQETRKPASVTGPETGNAPISSSAPATPPAGTVPSVQKPDHATGLDRAVERLQQNAVKSPQAAGLQHALEMLQRNQERGGTVDTQA